MREDDSDLFSRECLHETRKDNPIREVAGRLRLDLLEEQLRLNTQEEAPRLHLTRHIPARVLQR